jgi:hypothetical protein
MIKVVTIPDLYLNNRGLGCRDPVLFKSKKEKDDDDKKVDHVR